MKFLPKMTTMLAIPAELMKKGAARVPKAHVEDFKSDMEVLGEQLAEGFKDRIISNIEKNKYKFSLADSTIQKKGSSTPLVDSGEILNAIYRDGSVVSINDEPHSKSTLTNKQLAQVLEFGTKDKHIPARPVWRNTFDEYRKEAENQISTFLKVHEFSKPKEVEVPPIKKKDD